MKVSCTLQTRTAVVTLSFRPRLASLALSPFEDPEVPGFLLVLLGNGTLGRRVAPLSVSTRIHKCVCARATCSGFGLETSRKQGKAASHNTVRAHFSVNNMSLSCHAHFSSVPTVL